MLISITGRLGSGKSTVCKILAKNHGFEIYSTGAIQRKVARDMGISVLELNEKMKTDSTLDDIIDKATEKISIERRNDKLIFDSRMAWHFAVESFKVFVTVDTRVAAQRVMNDCRGAEESYASVQEAEEKLIARSNVERERFQAIYGVDYFDGKNYDLVVDSSYRTPDEVAEVIMKYYERYCADKEAYRPQSV